MASVLITRHTGCLGGGICDDRIRSAQTYLPSSRSGFDFWANFGDSSGHCGRRIYQTHCATHTGPDTDAVYGSPTPRTADAGRSAAVRVTRAATLLFTGVRVHCRLTRRKPQRSWPFDCPKQREGPRYFLWLTPVKDLCFASHLNAPPQHVPRDSPAIQRAFGCGCRSRSFKTREHSPVSSRRRKVQCYRQRIRKQVTPRPSPVSWITSGQK
ncbi:Hypothetical_protein [Hexamita inflata]|uniref:Hypothetical_protein n=1 Tax=Hexamita inflata TaxID=28002 RepID=A0AA86TPI8_9EUKA|nr:Hypothetical protein HINF_LOCUS11235 [Hexamita inflata]